MALTTTATGWSTTATPAAAGACNTGMPGVCTDGLETCQAGVLDCVQEVMASAEACDGLDNDCNGQVDDGNPGGGAACNTGLAGICAAGTQQCTAGTLDCQQNQMALPDELCGNGLDDDCNSQIDDGCSNCAHDVCVQGAALMIGCSQCVTDVCSFDPFCCNTLWDAACVGWVPLFCPGIIC